MPLAPFEPFKPSKTNPDQALIAFLNDHIRKLNNLIDAYGMNGDDFTVPDDLIVGGDLRTYALMSTGCIPSNGTDATNDINFSTGFQWDSSRLYPIRASSAFTKRADATWASGTGNGGMASGVSWGAGDYHMHLLGKSSDPSAFDYIFDTSATCANGLADSAVVTAGFNIYKRVGSNRTAGAAWQLFTARELAIGLVEFLLKTPLFELTKNWTGVDDAAQTGTLAFVPGGIQVNAILGALFFDSTAGAQSALIVSSLDQTDTAPDATPASYVSSISLSGTGGGNSRGSCVLEVRTSTSRTFRYRGNATTADHEASFATHGWRDSRL